MNGHNCSGSFWTPPSRAAEADAALMNGHLKAAAANGYNDGAAEADAALMNGHKSATFSLPPNVPPRRPTRP